MQPRVLIIKLNCMHTKKQNRSRHGNQSRQGAQVPHRYITASGISLPRPDENQLVWELELQEGGCEVLTINGKPIVLCSFEYAHHLAKDLVALFKALEVWEEEEVSNNG